MNETVLETLLKLHPEGNHGPRGRTTYARALSSLSKRTKYGPLSARAPKQPKAPRVGRPAGRLSY